MPIPGMSAETWSVIGSVATALGTVLTAIGMIFTAVGVWISRRSLLRSEEQAKTDFEDRLWQEYRGVIRNIPVEALVG